MKLANKEGKIYIFLSLLLFGFLVMTYAIPTFPQSSINVVEGSEIHGIDCIWVERADGTVEEPECSHNLIYDVAKDGLEACATGSICPGAWINISFCNATAGCGEPVAAASEAYTAIDGCNLSGIQGTYSSLGTGNWSLHYKFTSTCDGIETNTTRITNVTGGVFAGNSFTKRSLADGDVINFNRTTYFT